MNLISGNKLLKINMCFSCRRHFRQLVNKSFLSPSTMEANSIVNVVLHSGLNMKIILIEICTDIY